MKQLLLLPALILALTASAQTITFGVKAGPQFSSISDLNDTKAAFLYHLGAFAQMPLADRLTGQAELLFSAQGVNDTETDYLVQRNNYLTLPLMAKYDIWNGLSAHAGLQFGYLLSAKLKDTEDDYEDDRKDMFNKAEVGFLIGAEYRVIPKLNIGVRMNWGLTEVFDEYEGYKQRVFQVFAAYNLAGVNL